MKKKLFLFGCVAFLISCDDKTKTVESESPASEASSTATTNGNYEFADAKFKEIAKSGQQNLVSGDIDAWMTKFADNAVYRWTHGDSLAGKTAIEAYWKNRRSNVIDSIAFSNEVFLPVKVITPEAATQLPGNYCLAWYTVYARYKSGKSMSQRSHMVYHFDSNDKIDRVTQYIDAATIRAAEK